MSRGGPRPGAGRPPSGIKKQVVVIKLPGEVANALRAAVPDRWRSAWLEQVIRKALEEKEKGSHPSGARGARDGPDASLSEKDGYQGGLKGPIHELIAELKALKIKPPTEQSFR